MRASNRTILELHALTAANSFSAVPFWRFACRLAWALFAAAFVARFSSADDEQQQSRPTQADSPPADGTTSGSDPTHWAFRRLLNPTPAKVRAHHRVRTLIDSFVIAKLEAHGLSVSPNANGAALLRRTYFDLLGLPPDPDEVERALNEADADTHERLVDRLLVSPHFGERWGRHWLDAAGYVDVIGSDNDAATIKLGDGKWLYRDYVIRALNEDKPFDRFLVEQLAGDELVDWREAGSLTEEMRELLIATGFLRVAADDSDSPELNTPDIHFSVWQRTGEIVANNLLGLTLHCARCHDHMYDPLSQRDYYRWMAVFQPAFNPDKWLQPKQREVKRDGLTIQAAFDHGPPTETRVLNRGSYTDAGATVTPDIPAIVSSSSSQAAMLQPVGSTSGRRLALAQQLTQPDFPVAALVARVQVNRVWQHLFGRGLVATSDNFGVSGARPTHPELLDWLASEFVRGGWRYKPLIKQIMISTAYRQASWRPADDEGDAKSVDPDNDWLWRMRLRRGESEVIRDSLLAVSGKLDRALGGPPVPLHVQPDGKVVVKADGLPSASAQWRRTIYLLARRNYHLSLLDTFDQPAMSTNCTRRDQSAVVTQSLTMLNDEFVIDQARAFADRVAAMADTRDERIRAAFRLAFARDVSREESAWCAELLERHAARFRAANVDQAAAERRALVELCHTLLNTNEFLSIE